MRYKLGDMVEYSINGAYANFGVVIGEPHYSKDDIIVIATTFALGGPVNIMHIERKVGSDLISAMQYRNRYEEKFPNFLKIHK